MQWALEALKYYDGPLDGNFSKALEAAVIAFQQDFDLAPTGTIDYDTYLLLSADVPKTLPEATKAPDEGETPFVVKGEWYSDKEHVAAYIMAFGELPENYITRKEAQDLGWVNNKGNLWEVAPGMSIGGDRFGNYEELLPQKNGRQYYECDIDFDGEYRNAKRIVFSNDGLIFYTDDHYETFEEITP
ncbi:MAG: ribonuclease [Clostridiales bacterium]|nr:ribonuclease [Clostridiales bacterium]